MILGDDIRWLKKSLRISTHQLSVFLMVSSQSLSRWESETNIPSEAHMFLLRVLVLAARSSLDEVHDLVLDKTKHRISVMRRIFELAESAYLKAAQKEDR